MDKKGQYCELASWRKVFKRDWKWVATTPITMLLNNKYRPNTLTWVCTCPHFSTSQFLLCKHLVQDVHPVKRNQTTPFWKHPALISLDTPTSHLNSDDTILLTNMAAGQGDSDIQDDKESDDEGIIDIGGMENWSVGETMSLEREGVSLFRLASHCLEGEHRFNLMRGTLLTTWEKTTTSVMYYRTCPPHTDTLS
ncbi:hypothetical protein SERLA73DRAFT_120715 [Serpula lacrymans var. lacrymans S7.3]|uniref:SWIM-type domain-containing protein n=1 Tax=Serpula lacrymans var. lacrymans (strain S7.3) TaxID=936435 RepID=F8PPL6_SERL3|nr:hypothetical protein SERLA73DRAFT_120715 [Serpula lacrymans var. lacrymans S7.3]